MAIETHDLGNGVFCDYCGDDYTHSDAQGGILFGSHACCPKCAPKVEADAECYGEEQFIKARCPDGMSFREWCLFLRGGNNTVRVLTGQDAIDSMRNRGA